MVAMQLATEPLVRQAVRQVFQTRALLTVKPTKKGKKVRLYTCIHLLSRVAYRGRGDTLGFPTPSLSPHPPFRKLCNH